MKFKTFEKFSLELVNIKSYQALDLVCIDFLSLEKSKCGYGNILVIKSTSLGMLKLFLLETKLLKLLLKYFLKNLYYTMAFLLYSTVTRAGILQVVSSKSSASWLECSSLALLPTIRWEMVWSSALTRQLSV